MLENSKRFGLSTTLTLVVLFLPLLLQMQYDFVRGIFLSIGNNVLTNHLYFIIPWCIVLGVGCLVFPSSMRLTWVACLICLLLAAYQQVRFKLAWPTWRQQQYNDLIGRYTLQIFLLVLLVLQFKLSRSGVQYWRYAQFALVGCALFQSTASVLQYLTITRFGQNSEIAAALLVNEHPLSVQVKGVLHKHQHRFSGLIYNPGYAGAIMNLGWPSLLLALLKTSGRSALRVFLLIALLVCLVGIILTFSRSAYLALVLQLGYFAAFSEYRGRIWTKLTRGTSALFTLGWLVLGIGLIIVTIDEHLVASRFAAILDFQDRAVFNRLIVLGVAGRLLIERPFSGWGPGSFNTIFNRHYKIPGESYSFYDVHSAAANVLLEIGILGAGLWIVFLFGPTPLIGWRRLPVHLKMSCLGLLVILVTDNPGKSLAFLLPLMLILGSIVSITSHTWPSIPTRKFWITLILLCSIYLSAVMQPALTPLARLQQSLDEVWKGSSGTTAYCILTNNGDELLATSADVRSNVGNWGDIQVLGNAVCATQCGITTSPLFQGSRLALAAEEARCLNNCLSMQGAPVGYGWDAQAAVELERILSQSRWLKQYLQQASELSFLGDEYSWFITPRHMAHVLHHARVAADNDVLSVLTNSPWHFGLARHIPIVEQVVVHGSHSLFVHAEAISWMDRAGRGASVSVIRRENTPRLGVDQPALRAMGLFAWRVYLYNIRD